MRMSSNKTEGDALIAVRKNSSALENELTP
jgi:hypothetical protein